jgi:hypothetical protein
MEKKKKSSRFLKNRIWKSKIGNRLTGRAKDICWDYLLGSIDRSWAGHLKEPQKSEQ